MADKMYPFYESHGIKIEKNFDEVMEIADLYINDCSSTLYEFCVTGKPVVILNSPHFRKHITHGIRFWEYTDIGPVVEKPEELIPAINDALSSTLYKDNIDKMLTDLYPHFGNAAKTTAEAIIDFVEGKRL
jgi:UDP-N-acetylglucosamine:LPS N-acetylglucosamine transferase